MENIEKKLSDYTEIDTIDLAEALSNYTDEQIKNICINVDNEKLAIIIEECDEKVVEKIIDFIDNARILKIFNFMQKDDIVDLLGEIKIYRAKELINLMKKGEKTVIEELLGYKGDCAGGIMTTEYIAIHSDSTIEKAIKEIKAIVPKTEEIETIFVINRKNQLVGTAMLREILIAPENEIIEKITNINYIFVEPETDQEKITVLASKYNLKVIPVLNKKNTILGIITIDDILDVMVEEHTEDVLKMAGVSKEEKIDNSIGESIRLRLPWLIINLVTAFLAAMTVKAFEGTISKVVALSATMSIVTGMGGNSGTQTVSIIIRNIALENIKFKDCWPLLLKECLLGLINGSVIGVVTGIIVFIIYGNMWLGLIIFFAMIGNLIVAGAFGLMVPLLLDKLHRDPALASSIFLTTATDVLGFFIFLSLAKLFISHLV